MQLKARVNARAREAGIPPQAMMQNYLLERLLERLSLSLCRDRVVVKGGMLISSLVGVASRTTMDLDTTVRGFTLTHESAARVFREICAVEADDDWAFEVVRTEDIRETDDYPGIRVHLVAKYPPMAVPLTVDVTTGDRITPGAVAYEWSLLFDDRSIGWLQNRAAKGSEITESDRAAAHGFDLGIRTMRKNAAEALAGRKVGRNESCPCGSGKKFKRCCGR